MVLEDKVTALHDEVKELRGMLAKLQNAEPQDRQPLKQSLEEKISKAYTDLLLAAKEAGVTLPRL
jgi:hypothetical protein